MRALFANPVNAGPFTHVSAGLKLICTLVVAVLALSLSGLAGQLMLVALTTLYALGLKRFKLLLGLYAALIVMTLIALGFTYVIGLVSPHMASNKTSGLIIPFLRSVSMMNTVLVLALSTKVQDLLDTLERWHCPFWLFFPVSVMLRFIPTFFHDINQVWETLKIRGWPLGFRMLLTHPLAFTRLVLIPVLFRALKTADNLGVAAELKGIGLGGRTLRSPTGRSRTETLAWTGLIVATFAVVLVDVWLAPYLPTFAASMH